MTLFNGLSHGSGAAHSFWEIEIEKGTRSRGAGVARAPLVPAVVACRGLQRRSQAPLGTGGGVGPLVSATNIDLRAIGLS
jgi:hypothetical protein